jgi:hypothetical protein
MNNAHIIATVFITTHLATWSSLSTFSPQGQLACVVLRALPTYKKDGQEVVKHRAFILHIISKEDIV